MRWEPTTAQRRLLFVGLVAVLAGVGIYLTVPGLGQFGPGGGSPSPPPTSVAPGVGTADGGAASPAPGSGRRPSPEVTVAGPLRLLPLTEAEVGEAAGVARRFVHLFTTYSYDQDPRKYRDALSALATGPMAENLRQRSSALAGRARVDRRRVVSRSEVSMERIRLLSAGSVVFVVSAEQTIESTEGTRRQTKEYAVTVVRAGAGWKVSNVTLASLGDRGAEQ